MRGAFSALVFRYRYPGRCLPVRRTQTGPGLVCVAPLVQGLHRFILYISETPRGAPRGVSLRLEPGDPKAAVNLDHLSG